MKIEKRIQIIGVWQGAPKHKNIEKLITFYTAARTSMVSWKCPTTPSCPHPGIWPLASVTTLDHRTKDFVNVIKRGRLSGLARWAQGSTSITVRGKQTIRVKDLRKKAGVKLMSLKENGTTSQRMQAGSISFKEQRNGFSPQAPRMNISLLTSWL